VWPESLKPFLCGFFFVGRLAAAPFASGLTVLRPPAPRLCQVVKFLRRAQHLTNRAATLELRSQAGAAHTLLLSAAKYGDKACFISYKTFVSSNRVKGVSNNS
jgi:hypothetical protein